MTTLVSATPTPQELFNMRAFRVLLDCLARPGKIGQLPAAPLHGGLPSLPGGGLASPVAVATLLSLIDQRVGFAHASNGKWLESDHPLTRWIAIRSNAQPAAPEEADFALLHDPVSIVLLHALKSGTLLHPEQSCTVFLSVPEIIDGGATIRLSGPGIATWVTVGLSGVAPAELEMLAARREPFPLGIDIVLIDSRGRCLGLPRTTQMTLLH
ncbi:phosphonate C-P lyase system protein PhnH [Roseiflexus sp.]|uniref:phosphonate C-P lyase system protein PhnH n=1 Tax=Roseiflexus sp. TaxID=2562120 RepID=UPI00398A6AF3